MTFDMKRLWYVLGLGDIDFFCVSRYLRRVSQYTRYIGGIQLMEIKVTLKLTSLWHSQLPWWCPEQFCCQWATFSASPAWLLLPGFERLLAKELERCSLSCVTGCLFLKWENRLVVFPLYLSLVGGSHKAHRTCNTTTSYSSIARTYVIERRT